MRIEVDESLLKLIFPRRSVSGNDNSFPVIKFLFIGSDHFPLKTGFLSDFCRIS